MTTSTGDATQIWFLTGSQGLYGQRRSTRSPSSRAQIAAARSTRRRGCPAEIVWKPVLTDAGRDPPDHAGGQRRPGLHRRDRLDAHLLAGQDVDHRAGRAAQAAAAPAHPGQRGAAVGDDRHGLHEPQPGRARRPGVRLHPDPARRRRARRSPGTSPTRRVVRADRAWARAARGAPRLRGAAAGPVRRQHARRRGHRGRQGRGRAAVRRLGEHLRRQRPGRRSSTRSPTPSRRAGRRVRRRATSWRPSCAAGGERHESLRYAARIEAGPAAVPHRGRLRRVHHELRGPRRAAPAARPGRAAADGRRLRLRRRGRLEDLGAAAHASRRWAPGCRGGTSFMEDYTYHFGPGEPKILGAHMLEVCPSIAGGHAVAARSTRSASAAARTRSGWSSTPRPGPAVVVGLADLGDRFRLVANEIDVVAAGRAAAEAAGRPRGLEARARPVDLGRVLADRRRPAPHGAHAGASAARRSATSPRWSTPSCW